MTFALQRELIPHKDANLITVDDLLKCDGRTVAIDCETNGLHWWENVMIGLGVYCPEADVKGYITTWEQVNREMVQQAITQLGPDTVIVGHNIKFDLHFLGIDPLKQRWQLVDTMVLVHLMDSRNKKALESAAEQFLGIKGAKREYKLRGRKKKVWQWPTSLIAEYCTNDCVLTYSLGEKLLPIIVAQDQWDLFSSLMIYLGILIQIERQGFHVNVPFMLEARDELERVLREKEKELYVAVGYKFNWRSTAQLSKAIYDDMGIPKPENPFKGSETKTWRSAVTGRTVYGTRIQTKYTDTATSAFLLMEKAKHPLGELILDLREISILWKNVKKWLQLKDSNDVIHTNLKLTGTRTGRLASADPNLQNLPGFARTRSTQSAFSGKMTREGIFNLRQTFVPRPGHVIVAIDWKQMEIRMFGLLAEDEEMLDALLTGEDVHANVATAIWGIGDKLHREWAKTISFGLIYGMTTGSVQFRLNVSKEDAHAMCERYWTAFPRIKPWLNEVMTECHERGFVTYWSGRRWYEEEDIDLYKAVNAKVQGGCADLLMEATIRCWEFLQANYPMIPIISLVHDEIDFEVPKDLVAEVVPQLQHIMEMTDVFGITFFTDVTMGYNYGDMRKIPDEEIPKWEKLLS